MTLEHENHKGFAQKWWDADCARSFFLEALEEAGLCEGAHFEKIGGDDYDNSIEFYGVDNDVRLTEAQQRIIHEAGFSTAYVNHKDGWETHYNWKWDGPFTLSRGWRRRWVGDQSVSTSRGIGHHDPGYWEIGYWPESWGERSKADLKKGYYRIVPDPLEAENAS